MTRFFLFSQHPFNIYAGTKRKSLEFNKKGTKDFGILYKKNTIFTVVGYSNVDFAGDIDDRTSNSGYLMNMG